MNLIIISFFKSHSLISFTVTISNFFYLISLFICFYIFLLFLLLLLLFHYINYLMLLILKNNNYFNFSSLFFSLRFWRRRSCRGSCRRFINRSFRWGSHRSLRFTCRVRWMSSLWYSWWSSRCGLLFLLRH